MVVLTSPMDANYATVSIGGCTTSALIDTGAALSCITMGLNERANINISFNPSDINSIVGVGGDVTPVVATAIIPITINRLVLPHKFYIFKKLHKDLVIGIDFMKTHHMDILVSQQKLQIHEGLSEAKLSNSPAPDDMASSIVSGLLYQLDRIESVMSLSLSSSRASGTTVLLQPHPTLTTRTSLLGARCVAITNQGSTMYSILNPTNRRLGAKGSYLTLVRVADRIL